MSATNHTQHGLVQYILDDEPMIDDTNGDNLIIEQGLQKIDDHTADQNNPHATTKDTIGLGNVDNTSDADKPVSMAQQAALNLKIDKTAIVDNLTTGGVENVLSAQQGVVLNNTKADQPYQLHTQTDGGFHVEDSAGGLVADCVIGGNGWQSRQGKNLVDLIAAATITRNHAVESSITANSVIITNNQQDTGTARVSYVRFRTRALQIGATYTASCEFERLTGDESVIGAPKCTVYGHPSPGGGSGVNLGSFQQSNSPRSRTFTVPAEAPYIFLLFYSQENQTTTAEEGSAKFYNIQLEEGSTATPYEPYTPDPSPEAPIMPVCLPEGTKIAIVGKNEFDGVSVLDAYFGAASSLISSSTQTKTVYAKCLPNTTYTISKIASRRLTVGYTNQFPVVGASVSGAIENNTAQSLTITTGPEAKYIVAYVHHAKHDTPITAEEMIASVQIEKSPIATLYEPYTNPTTLVTPCDLWKWDRLNVLTGDVVTRSVVIPSYNGETITGEYVSSTGGLDVGAYVVYDSGIETVTQYDPQPITLPAGTVNMVVESENGVLPSEVDMLYRQDLKAYIESIVNGLMDTMATNITDLTVRVTELETAGGD